MKEYAYQRLAKYVLSETSAEVVIYLTDTQKRKDSTIPRSGALISFSSLPTFDPALIMPVAFKAENPIAFFLHGIGDALLALPALRALAQLFEGRLTIVCQDGIYNLFYRDLPLRDHVPIKLDGRTLAIREARFYPFDASGIANQIGDCDLFLSLVSWRSQWLDQLLDLLKPRVCMGLAAGFDTSVPRRTEQHAMDHAFALPLFFDSSLTLEEFSSPPLFRPEAEQHAGEIIAMLPKGSRILAVQTESEERKSWSPALLHGTLQRFLQHHAEFWALLLDLKNCPPADGWRNLQVIPCDSLALDTSMCLIERASLFLGVDSCMLHFADLCRIPSVGLFGPTRYSEFGSRLSPHYHVSGHGTMAGVGIDEVLNGLESLLANDPVRTKSPAKVAGVESRRSSNGSK